MRTPANVFATMKLIMGAALLIVVSYDIASSSADVVWINGQADPRFGQIVSSTPQQIEIQIFENGKLGRIENIDRSQIEQMISNIDTQRLEQLSPDHPADYRNYAEELASQRIDPAARHLARRLYLIAAANSVGDDEAANAIRTSALAGLISIANSAEERSRLQMLRFLLSSAVDQVELLSESRSIAFSKNQARLMLKLVQAIRRENSELAVELLNSQDNRAMIQIWSEICPLEELDRIARVNRPSKPQLSKLLRIELQIVSNADIATRQTPAEIRSDGRQDWGDFATQETGLLGGVPSLENVTLFDPVNSVFRNGQWVRPEIKSEK